MKVINQCSFNQTFISIETCDLRLKIMNLTLGLFTLLPVNLSMLCVLQPLNSEEAYIAAEFQNDLSYFNVDPPKWPNSYERMELIHSEVYEKNVFSVKSSSLLKNQNKLYVRYQIRFVLKNRTYEDSKFVVQLWNDSLLKHNHYYILSICFSLIIIITIILILGYLYYFKLK